MNKPLFILRRLAKQLLVYPISPKAVVVLITILRGIGVLRKPDNSAQGEQIREIFVSHPYSSVGDVVLLLPLLERVKREWPDAAIDIVVGDNVCDLLGGITWLRNVFVCGSHRSRLSILGDYKRFFRHLLLYKRQIMRYSYDLAIAPRWGSIQTSDAVYLVYLTGAHRRIGYSGSVDGGDATINALLTHTATGGEHEHETLRNLRLLDRAGLTAPELGDEISVIHPIRALVNLAQQESIDLDLSVEAMHLGEKAFSRKYAIVSPGATAAFRSWPLESLAWTLKEVHEKTNLVFYVVGSPNDATLCQTLANCHPGYTISIAGKTNLKQLVRLLDGAELFLGMDSGIAHISGALGVPTIVISPFPASCKEDHPNSPIRFKPCGPRIRVLQPLYATPPCQPTCSFPGPHCIREVTPEDVIEVATRLIGVS